MPTVTVPPSYGDFSTADDYHALQNRIAETNALFYKLPRRSEPATRTTLASGSRREHQNRQQRPGTAPRNGHGRTLRHAKGPTEGGTTPGAPAPEPRKRAPMRP